MKRTNTILIFTLFCCNILFAQIHYQSNLGSGKALEVIEKADTGFWLLAEIDSNFWSITLDEYGDEEERFWISEGGGKITFSKDGNIYTAHEDNLNILVQKFDYQGNMIWLETYDYFLNEHSPEIFATQDSGVVVSNLVDTLQTVFINGNLSDVPYTKAEIVKFDKNGIENWEVAIGTGASFSNNFIIERENGNFIFYSKHIAAPPWSNLYIHDYTLELDSNGTLTNSDSYLYGTVGIGGLESLDLAPTTDGNFVKVRKYTSWTTHGGGEYLSLVKTDDVDNAFESGQYQGDYIYNGCCATNDDGYMEHFKIIPTNDGGFIQSGRSVHNVTNWNNDDFFENYQRNWSLRKIRDEGDILWQTYLNWDVLNGIEMQNSDYALCGKLGDEIIFAIMDKDGIPADIQVSCFVENETPMVGDTIELICIVHNQSPNIASNVTVEINAGLGLEFVESIESFNSAGDFQSYESKNIIQKYLVTGGNLTYFYAHLTDLWQIDFDSEAGSSECCDDYEDDEFLLNIYPMQSPNNSIGNGENAFFQNNNFGNKILENNFTHLKISPNPFSDNFNVEFQLAKSENFQISVKNILGQTMDTYFNKALNYNEKIIQNINTIDWKSGTYFLIVKNEEQQVIRKIIKI